MREALERVYREHRQGLYTLALSIARAPDAAEDAVHDAFVRLCRAGSPPPIGELVPYVYAAVRNAAIDGGRKRQRDGRLAASVFAEGGPGSAGRSGAEAAGADAERAEMEGRVRAMVDALPDKQRETLVLKLYSGLTFEQVAQVMGEPMGTITARYRRTVERMRESLEVVA